MEAKTLVKIKEYATVATLLSGLFGGVFYWVLNVTIFDPMAKLGNDYSKLDKEHKELKEDVRNITNGANYATLKEFAEHFSAKDLRQILEEMEEFEEAHEEIEEALEEVDDDVKMLKAKQIEQDNHIGNLFQYKHPKGAYDYSNN